MVDILRVWIILEIASRFYIGTLIIVVFATFKSFQSIRADGRVSSSPVGSK